MFPFSIDFSMLCKTARGSQKKGLLGNISPILGEVPSGEYQWCQTPRPKRAVGVSTSAAENGGNHKTHGCFLMTVWFWRNKIKNCKACKWVAMCIYFGISINVNVGRTKKSGNWASPLLKWPSSQLYNRGLGRGSKKKTHYPGKHLGFPESTTLCGGLSKDESSCTAQQFHRPPLVPQQTHLFQQGH